MLAWWMLGLVFSFVFLLVYLLRPRRPKRAMGYESAGAISGGVFSKLWFVIQNVSALAGLASFVMEMMQRFGGG